MKWVYDNPTYIDRDDCSIRAFAKLLDKPYVDIKKDLIRLKLLNRIKRYYYWDNVKKYIKMNNLQETKRFNRLKVKEIPDKGKYLIYVDGHLLTVIDGVLYDSWDSRDEIIQSAWSIGE